MTGIIAFLVITLIAIVMVRFIIGHSGYEETTIYTGGCDVNSERPNIAGNLRVQVDSNNNQDFVLDPVDQKKMYVNTNDDGYEDVDGKLWRLVR